MSFILGFLGTVLGIVVAFLVIVLLIYLKLVHSFGYENVGSLKDAIRNAKALRHEEYARPKDVTGITRLLEPEIIRDFSDFNKDVLYGIIETNLRKIFNAISNKSLEGLKDDSDLILIYPGLEKQIIDLKKRNSDIKYSDVVFHEHAISRYEKMQGMATITTSTTLEYYTNSEKKDNEEYKNIKKQTRYTCKFVYIYDEEKLGRRTKLFSIHCPNCGAPLTQFGDEVICEYCCSHVKSINLKLWKMSSYKEDYK